MSIWMGIWMKIFQRVLALNSKFMIYSPYNYYYKYRIHNIDIEKIKIAMKDRISAVSINRLNIIIRTSVIIIIIIIIVKIITIH